jgi:uroporphyrinogen III methyltransferase/synthase
MRGGWAGCDWPPGPGTADELARYHLRADLVPSEFRAESLADELATVAAGKRFLLARASRGREVLADQLRAAGATVDQIVVYTSRDVPNPEPAVVELLATGQLDWITVTSPPSRVHWPLCSGRAADQAWQERS